MSNSKNIKTTKQDVERLIKQIKTYKPKVVHSEVYKAFTNTSNNKNIPDKYGYIEKLITGINTRFYRVPFPHRD